MGYLDSVVHEVLFHLMYQLMGNLDFKAATEEITQSVKYLKSTGSPKVGTIGFCMGGALTFCAAQHSGVDCAVPFYGTPGAAVCTPEDIKVPLQAHFGELDTLKGFSDVEVSTVCMQMVTEYVIKDLNPNHQYICGIEFDN